ncbi:Lcl domain-containing protein [Leptospira koniambonensis]|uniref:Lcl domain-containing protein n=1 Tax=Leptospira koniambonensis TaxID=2484950 RepID=UPI003EBD4651
MGAGGGLNSFHCGQTVANPVNAGFTVTTNSFVSNANNDAFVAAMGGNNCETPALVDNDNGTVTDTANHFLWTLCTGYNPSGSGTILKYNYTTGDCDAGGSVTGDDNNITLAQAETFCNSLTFAGHSDWVLPDAIQLFSLYTPTTPFALGSFGTKKSITRTGAWSTTQTTSSDTVVNSFGSATQRFFTTTASTNGISSFICVAKI